MPAGSEAKENNPSCIPQMKRLKFGSKKSAPAPSSRRDLLRLDDKVAIITGAASGIGAATARLFVAHGAKVVIADVNADAGKKLSSELGSSVHFFHCDVTNEADVAATVDYAMQAWGHLDIMFNNAGVSGPLSGLAGINIEEIDQVMAVHIKGAVLGVKHASRVMIPAGKGVILFSGSTSAALGGAGPPLHSAANAAVLCIVRSAAAELVQHGIRVNAVSTHCVATPMVISLFNSSVNPKMHITAKQFEKFQVASSQLDVLTKSEKVAYAVLFLASDEAGSISGHNLVLDGAFSVTKQFDSSTLKAALEKSLASECKAEAEAKREGPSPTGNVASEGSKASIAMEPQAGGKAREKEEKAAQKASAAKEKEEQKEKKIAKEKALAKQEKARAKEEKALAKEGKAPAKDDPETHRAKDDDIHPLDSKALAKEERVRNENIEPQNAGPEPDIPLEFLARPQVKKIGNLLSWKKDKADDKSAHPGKVSKQEEKDDKSPDQEKVSKKEILKHDKSAGPGKEAKAGTDSKNSPKTADSPEPQLKQSPMAKISRMLSPGKDKQQEKSTDPGKASKEEKKDDKSSDPGKKSDKAQTEIKDSPKPADSPEPQLKQSPMAKISRMLSPGKDKKQDQSTDPGKASKEAKKDDKSSDPGKAAKARTESKDSPGDSPKPGGSPEPQLKQSPMAKLSRMLSPGKEKKQDAKSTDPGKKDKAKTESKDSPKTADSPEPQLKQSPMAKISRMLSPGKDKKQEKSTDSEKASKKEKKEAKSADPGKAPKNEAKLPAKGEKTRTGSKDSPKTAGKQSLLAKISKLLSPGKDKKQDKASKKEKTADKPNDTGKVLKKEAKSPPKQEKARTESKNSPKRAASPEITPDPGNVSKK